MHKPGRNKNWVQIVWQRHGMTRAHETGIIDQLNVLHGIIASNITEIRTGSRVVSHVNVRYARYILPEYDADVWTVAALYRRD